MPDPDRLLLRLVAIWGGVAVSALTLIAFFTQDALLAAEIAAGGFGGLGALLWWERRERKREDEERRR